MAILRATPSLHFRGTGGWLHGTQSNSLSFSIPIWNGYVRKKLACHFERGLAQIFILTQSVLLSGLHLMLCSVVIVAVTL